MASILEEIPAEAWSPHWPAVRNVALDYLLCVVHDLGAPTQARVDAASAILAAATAAAPDLRPEWRP